MRAKITLTSGKAFVIDGDANKALDQLITADPFAKIDVPSGTAYVFREHVVSIEDEPDAMVA